MCDKKVRYSDAKKMELHVFPRSTSSDDSGDVDLRDEIACGSSAGAASRAARVLVI